MNKKEKLSFAFKLDCIELHRNYYRSIESTATEKIFTIIKRLVMLAIPCADAFLLNFLPVFVISFTIFKVSKDGINPMPAIIAA